MNKEEKKIFDVLSELVASYDSEDNEDSKNNIFQKINEVSTSKIERSFLDSYWKSMSIEEFSQIYATIKVDVKQNTEKEIHNFLQIIISNIESDNYPEYSLNKYSDAIEYFYKQSTGTLVDLIYQDGISEFDELLAELKKPNVISL